MGNERSIFSKVSNLTIQFLNDFTKSILLKQISWLNQHHRIPIRVWMGGSKNITISRFLVDQFIDENKNQINGHILEIGRNVYKTVIPSKNIISYHCLDIEDFPDIDIVADIQDMKEINVHNPGETDHQFRRKPSTDSGGCRPLIPAQGVHFLIKSGIE